MNGAIIIMKTTQVPVKNKDEDKNKNEDKS